jgi:CheY-like chemotaxis protein
MPDLGGTETLQLIRQRWPAVKVVLTSGYMDPARLGSALPEGCSVLEKPYRTEQLLSRLHDELSEHAHPDPIG